MSEKFKLALEAINKYANEPKKIAVLDYCGRKIEVIAQNGNQDSIRIFNSFGYCDVTDRSKLKKFTTMAEFDMTAPWCINTFDYSQGVKRILGEKNITNLVQFLVKHFAIEVPKELDSKGIISFLESQPNNATKFCTLMNWLDINKNAKYSGNESFVIYHEVVHHYKVYKWSLEA